MKSSVKEPKDAPSLGELTGMATLAIGLISAWLYFAGWTYAYHYFDRFGIPLLMIDIPKENYFAYGGVVIQQFLLWELGIAALVVGTFVWWRSRIPDFGKVRIALGTAALVGAFWLAHWAAVQTAQMQYLRLRANDYSAFPRVQIWAKDVSATQSEPAGLADGCYRLLLHNQDRLFLLRPFRGAPAADLPVLVSPWDQIKSVRILPDYESCD